MTVRSKAKRSFVKGVTWESFAWFLTAAVAYLYTGSVGESTALATTLFGLKVAFYFLHELAWQNIDWGKLE